MHYSCSIACHSCKWHMLGAVKRWVWSVLNCGMDMHPSQEHCMFLIKQSLHRVTIQWHSSNFVLIKAETYKRYKGRSAAFITVPFIPCHLVELVNCVGYVVTMKLLGATTQMLLSSMQYSYQSTACGQTSTVV